MSHVEKNININTYDQPIMVIIRDQKKIIHFYDNNLEKIDSEPIIVDSNSDTNQVMKQVNDYGICCFCGEPCNPCSQSCGHCLRSSPT
jgi:Barwin family.